MKKGDDHLVVEAAIEVEVATIDPSRTSNPAENKDDGHLAVEAAIDVEVATSGPNRTPHPAVNKGDDHLAVEAAIEVEVATIGPSRTSHPAGNIDDCHLAVEASYHQAGGSGGKPRRVAWSSTEREQIRLKTYFPELTTVQQMRCTDQVHDPGETLRLQASWLSTRLQKFAHTSTDAGERLIEKYDKLQEDDREGDLPALYIDNLQQVHVKKLGGIKDSAHFCTGSISSSHKVLTTAGSITGLANIYAPVGNESDLIHNPAEGR